VNAAPSGGQACPGAGTSTLLVVQWRPSDASKTARIRVPAPVRTFEPMRLSLITADGRDWLGFRGPTDGSFVPVIGPLQTGGVLFQYWTGSNTETSNPNLVKSISLRLVGETERNVNQGVSSTLGLATEPVTLRVQLRNSR
jgi:hypothetical protein